MAVSLHVPGWVSRRQRTGPCFYFPETSESSCYEGEVGAALGKGYHTGRVGMVGERGEMYEYPITNRIFSLSDRNVCWDDVWRCEGCLCQCVECCETVCENGEGWGVGVLIDFHALPGGANGEAHTVAGRVVARRSCGDARGIWRLRRRRWCGWPVK